MVVFVYTPHTCPMGEWNMTNLGIIKEPGDIGCSSHWKDTCSSLFRNGFKDMNAGKRHLRGKKNAANVKHYFF